MERLILGKIEREREREREKDSERENEQARDLHWVRGPARRVQINLWNSFAVSSSHRTPLYSASHGFVTDCSLENLNDLKNNNKVTFVYFYIYVYVYR